MRERNIARPAGRFGLGRRGTAAAVSVRVAFVAAAACCALTWAPVSSAGNAARAAAAPPAGHPANVAAPPVEARPVRLASDRVDLALRALKAMTVPLPAAPAGDGVGAPAAAPAGGGGSPTAGASPTAVAPAGGVASPAATALTAVAPTDGSDGPAATTLSGDYAAYVTAIDPVHATVTFDVVEWFTGTAAQQACTQDGNPGPWPAEQCNDYYVRDKNVVLRTLSVAPSVKVRYVDDNGPTAGVSLDDPSGGDVPGTLTELAGKRAQLGPDGRLKCFITVESGALTSIAEIFTP
jgi:hypothetical protein